MRAMVTKPKVLFIDEPFSALDYENNLRLREHLQKYFLAFKPTILLITHNIEEAVHLAEKIVVFSQKPTKVLEVIDNPLPYPRTLQSLKVEQFHQTKLFILPKQHFPSSDDQSVLSMLFNLMLQLISKSFFSTSNPARDAKCNKLLLRTSKTNDKRRRKCRSII